MLRWVATLTEYCRQYRRSSSRLVPVTTAPCWEDPGLGWSPWMAKPNQHSESHNYGWCSLCRLRYSDKAMSAAFSSSKGSFTFSSWPHLKVETTWEAAVVVLVDRMYTKTWLSGLHGSFVGTQLGLMCSSVRCWRETFWHGFNIKMLLSSNAFKIIFWLKNWYVCKWFSGLNKTGHCNQCHCCIYVLPNWWSLFSD